MSTSESTSKTIDDGGPAFPRPYSQFNGPNADEHYRSQEGMTTRVFLAAKILQGFCANPAIFAPNSATGWRLNNATPPELVAYAFHIADQAILEMNGKGSS